MVNFLFLVFSKAFDSMQVKKNNKTINETREAGELLEKLQCG